MVNISIICLLVLTGLYSSSQTNDLREINPIARRLGDSAIRMTYTMNESGYRKAISLLDEATALDSNFFMAYWNKFVFQLQLKQYAQALITTHSLIRIRPSAQDIYLTRGLINERMGDTIAARGDFQKGLSILDGVLDTMGVGNRDYDVLFLNKAIDLIMLGEQVKGNELIKQLADHLEDQEFKRFTLSFLNKTKREVIETIDNYPSISNEGSSSATVEPITQDDDYLIQFTNTVKGEYGYKDTKGAIVIPAGKYPACFTDTFRNYAIVTWPHRGFVAIDRQEHVLYNVFPFDHGPDYSSEGLFRMVDHGKIGFADSATGKIAIQPMFACAYPIDHGVAKVSMNCESRSDGEHSVWVSDNWYYIDKTGKKVNAPKAK
jgi:hypothetical protein